MTIYLPGQKTDIFGGPQGTNTNAIQKIIAGILQGSEKRRQNRQNQMARGIISGVSADNPNASSTDFVNALLGSNLRPETVKRFSDLYGIQSDINVNEARAQNLRTPKATKVETIWAGKSGDPESWIPVDYTQGSPEPTIQKLKTQGYDRFRKTPPSEKTEEYGEPVKKGNTWVQQNLKTKRYVKAYSDPEGWSKTFRDEDGNKVQENLDTGEIKVITKTPTESASQKISQLKLDAWNAYLSGKATPEQESMIGTDRDPFLAPAANAVQADINYAFLSAEKKIEKIIELADTMRQASKQKGSTGSNIPPLPPNFVLDQ